MSVKFTLLTSIPIHFRAYRAFDSHFEAGKNRLVIFHRNCLVPDSHREIDLAINSNGQLPICHPMDKVFL